MDVLKDITEGLRKDGESERDESARDESEQAETDREEADKERSNSRENHKSPESRESCKPHKSGESRKLSEPRESIGDPNEDDAHVCSFCEAEFDAEREICPECDARIVLRGAR